MPKKEETLEQAESKYRTVADFTYDWEFWQGLQGEFLYVSPSCKRITGREASEFLANPLLFEDIIHPDDLPLWKDHRHDSEEDMQVSSIVFRVLHTDGSIRFVEHACLPVHDASGMFLGIRGSNRDVTERKRAEDALRSSLAEKETLLREVHHRVKNNLAVVLALVDVQQKAVGDSSVRKALNDLGLRINAMALVHELLYKSKDLSKIDFQNYIHELVSRLLSSIDAPKDLRFVVSAEGKALGLDTSIPLGMIVNELVMNALKYAFPEGKPRCGQKECELSVLVEHNGGLWTLIVADNGRSLPKNFDWKTTTTSGFRIVRALGEHQLAGVWEYDGSLGTRFILKFTPKHEA